MIPKPPPEPGEPPPNPNTTATVIAALCGPVPQKQPIATDADQGQYVGYRRRPA